MDYWATEYRQKIAAEVSQDIRPMMTATGWQKRPDVQIAPAPVQQFTKLPPAEARSAMKALQQQFVRQRALGPLHKLGSWGW